ncbi:MAG: hypothetical protein Q7R49_06465 [Candidatus Daviesbacteria bacterium]|nr:hypothetical protein [Candidatus Daviesbacteria bacterium]
MQVTNDSLINPLVLTYVIQAAIYIIVSFYAIFALVVVRQVTLMSKTLITPVSPIVRGVAIIHGGFAIGFAVFIIGTL